MIINHHFRVEIKAHKFNSSTANKRFSYPIISNLTSHFFISNLLRSGLESFRDCLAHLEVLEGFSERGPNKQGLERTLWGTHVRRRDGWSVLMVGSKPSLPRVMMKSDLNIALTWKKISYLVVPQMISLWLRHTVIKKGMIDLRGNVSCPSYQLILTLAGWK